MDLSSIATAAQDPEIRKTTEEVLQAILEKLSADTATSQSEFEIVMKVILLSFVVERALTVLFETRTFFPWLEQNRGWKTSIAYGVSIAVCIYWKIDLLGALFSNGRQDLPGYILTAAVIAGGSKASVKLFRDYFDIRSRFAREYEQEQAHRVTLARQNVEEILRLQDYMTSYGYLPRSPNTSRSRGVVTSPSVIPGELDNPTQEAIRTLQTRFGLRPTGLPDTALLKLLETPRCASNDTRSAAIDLSRWKPRDLQWTLGSTLPETLYPSGNGSMIQRCRVAIEKAFKSWEQELVGQGWRFTEARQGAPVDIKLDWVFWPDPDDKMGQIDVAHATFPGEAIPLIVHFDRSVKWSDAGEDGCYDLESVALHEIGHCLGRIGHSSSQSNVMYATVSMGSAGIRRRLTEEDIQDVKRLYS